MILSSAFLPIEWPQKELDGLVVRKTTSGEKTILPTWHQIDCDTLIKYLPSLADKLAVN